MQRRDRTSSRLKVQEICVIFLQRLVCGLQMYVLYCVKPSMDRLGLQTSQNVQPKKTQKENPKESIDDASSRVTTLPNCLRYSRTEIKEERLGFERCSLTSRLSGIVVALAYLR